MQIPDHNSIAGKEKKGRKTHTSYAKKKHTSLSMATILVKTDD